MMQRCRNPKAAKWGLYGGRGISVCDRWLLFENFLADVGPRGAGRSLDRIDPNGHYEPGNCRWATIQEQNYNLRKNRLVTHNGITLCVAEWAARNDMRGDVLGHRLNLGWSMDRALTTPSSPRRVARRHPA